MKIENATLRESLESMEHLTSTIHRLRASLSQVTPIMPYLCQWYSSIYSDIEIMPVAEIIVSYILKLHRNLARKKKKLDRNDKKSSTSSENSFHFCQEVFQAKLFPMIGSIWS